MMLVSAPACLGIIENNIACLSTSHQLGLTEISKLCVATIVQIHALMEYTQLVQKRCAGELEYEQKAQIEANTQQAEVATRRRATDAALADDQVRFAALDSKKADLQSQVDISTSEKQKLEGKKSCATGGIVVSALGSATVFFSGIVAAPFTGGFSLIASAGAVAGGTAACTGLGIAFKNVEKKIRLIRGELEKLDGERSQLIESIEIKSRAIEEEKKQITLYLETEQRLDAKIKQLGQTITKIHKVIDALSTLLISCESLKWRVKNAPEDLEFMDVGDFMGLVSSVREIRGSVIWLLA